MAQRGGVRGGQGACCCWGLGIRKCYFKWCDRGQRAESVAVVHSAEGGRGGGVAHFTFSYPVIACDEKMPKHFCSNEHATRFKVANATGEPLNQTE